MTHQIGLILQFHLNNVNSIYFSLSDKKLDEIKNELIIDAIESKSRYHAASALGHKVVGIRTASIDQVTPYFPGPAYATESLKNEAFAPSTPILTENKQISFSLIFIS